MRSPWQRYVKVKSSLGNSRSRGCVQASAKQLLSGQIGCFLCPCAWSSTTCIHLPLEHKVLKQKTNELKLELFADLRTVWCHVHLQPMDSNVWYPNIFAANTDNWTSMEKPLNLTFKLQFLTLCLLGGCGSSRNDIQIQRLALPPTYNRHTNASEGEEIKKTGQRNSKTAFASTSHLYVSVLLYVNVRRLYTIRPIMSLIWLVRWGISVYEPPRWISKQSMGQSQQGAFPDAPTHTNV